jgi:hypothetical protein
MQGLTFGSSAAGTAALHPLAAQQSALGSSVSCQGPENIAGVVAFKQARWQSSQGLAWVELQSLMSSGEAPAGPSLPMPITSQVCHLLGAFREKSQEQQRALRFLAHAPFQAACCGAAAC